MPAERKSKGGCHLSKRTYARRVQWLVDMVEWLGEGNPQVTENLRAKLRLKLQPKGSDKVKS